MLRLIRDIHLAVGLFCTPFVMVYALDGVRVNHGKWVPTSQSTTQHSYPVSATTPEAVARELHALHGVHGKYWPPSADGKFFIGGPAASYSVRFDPASGTAEVEKRRPNLFSLATGLHVRTGVNDVHAPFNAWGWLVLLVSASFLVLGVTGLWLWIPRLRERKLGLVFLVGSLGYCGLCLALIRFA